MRKIYTVFLIAILFAVCLQTAFASGGEKAPASQPLACPIPGIYTIGPGGDYTSITTALVDLNSCPSLSGAYIFELMSTYVSAIETFPITINNFTGSSAANTITFRPQAGATALSITSANATGTLLFDGGDFIRFDGRPGGAGTAKELTIQNTNLGNSYAIRFANDATDNTISYCMVKSANNNTAGATIIIAGTSGAAGNDNITIDHNDICDAPTGTPSNGILSAGNTSPALFNNNIVISNNNIYNFYAATGNIAGINVTQGCSDWTISSNDFYYTFGTSKTITGIFSAISAYNSEMNNFTITGNYVGGPTALPGGYSIYILGSGILQVFRLSLGTASVNNLQGNTVWNIFYGSVASSPFHSIINLADGTYNVGTTTGNIIGSANSSGNIATSMNNPAAGNNFSIINCGSGVAGVGTVTISNNLVGNIDMVGTSSSCNFQLINFSGNSGIYAITNNTLGSPTYVTSINHYINTAFTAINGNMSSGTHQISNNIIANVWHRNTNNNGILYGIRVQGNAAYTITGNSISGFRSFTTKTTGYTIVGINNSAAAANQVISGNNLQSFSTADPSVRTGIAGIYYSGLSAGDNIIERNFIHSFVSSSTAAATSFIGIHAAGGIATYRNNMVRLGITSAGTPVTTGYDIEGIYEESGTNDFYFNSVYIGGSGVGAGSASYAFNSSISTNTVRNYKNNIFWNDRSNASATSPSHYAIKIGGTAGLASDYNVLLATGTGRIVTNIAGTDYPVLAQWRSNTGGDASSYSVNPQFVNPTGTNTTVDLHIKPSPTPTVTESTGVLIASVTGDYDLQTRASLTPTDIGADASNLTPVLMADMGAINLLNPATFACYNPGAQVKVVIKNFRSFPINFAVSPVSVTVNVTGAGTGALSTTINTGSLAAGDTLIVTLPGSLNMSAAGTYNFSIATIVGGTYTDIDITNNVYTTSVTPGTYNIGTVSSSVANFCNSGIPTLTLTGTFGTVQWQESTTSDTGPWTNVGSNSLTYTPVAINATTYYQALVSCGASNGPSNAVTVFVIPASIANTAALADGAASTAVCEGSSITLTQTGGSIVPGAQWQWYQGTAANNFITPVGPVLTSADALLVVTPTASTNYYLRASGGTAPCDGNVPASNTGNPAAAVTVNLTGTWLGNNANWNDAANWCYGVPTATTDALIPTGLSIYPIISTVESVRNISISPGASVTLNSTGALTVKGNYTNTNGTIINNGSIILNGSSLQSFPGSTATIGAMNILELNNPAGISIDRSFTVTGKLQPTAGTVSLNNSDITIHSDATATANVGQLGAGVVFNYNGTGKFIVERFIPARRAWRILTAPVTAATGGSINSTWQEGTIKWPMGPATAASNPNDGYGTHISGGSNANGYDQNVNGNASIKIFSAGTWGGLPVSTSLYTKKVTDEPGYMLFVRGSRGVDLSYGVLTVPDNTVLRTQGQLKVANTIPISVTAAGLSVLANPFASAINFNSIATLNGLSLAENKYYVWDPTLTGAYGVGAWVTLAYNGSTYDRTVSSFNDYTSSGGSQGIDNIGTIQSGAAVMVNFGSTAKTINLNETIKINGSSSLLFRTVKKQMRANLYVENSSSPLLIDGVLVTYDPSYKNNADDLDVNKLTNFSENFGLKREDKIFAIERRSPVTVRDTIFLNMAQMRVRNYQLAFEPDSMQQDNLACYLEDTYLNKKTPVSLIERTLVPFSITDNASAAKDRFRVVFNPWIGFINCKAAFKNEETMITWQVTGENDLDKYEIERSDDGLNFSVIGNVPGTGNDAHAPYSYNDPYAAAGNYYYRIKASSKHGVVAYSPVANVTVYRLSSSLYVFPNPVIDNKVYLQVSSRLPAGEYHLKLMTSDGKIVNNKKITHPGGGATYSIMPGTTLAAGIYQLEVVLPGKASQLLKVMVK